MAINGQATSGGASAALRGWERIVILVILGLGAAVFYPLNRIASDAGLPFFGFIFWQCLGGFILLALLMAVRRERMPLSWSHMKFYAVSALLGLVFPYLSIFIAASNLPVGVLSMGFTLEPAFTYLLALFFVIERFHALRFAGLLTGVAGIMLIVLPETSLPEPGMVPWVALGLVAPISWAGWSVWATRARPPAVPPLALTTAMMGFGALFLLPLMLGVEGWWWFADELSDGGWTVVALAFGNAFFWWLGMTTVSKLGPVFYSTWGFFGTPLTVLAGILVFSERHSLWVWSALALLLLSLYLVNRTTSAAQAAGGN